MSHIADMERYYSERATEYESTAAYAHPRNAVVMAPIKARYQIALEGHDVLEIACGPGYWTEAVAVTARTLIATDRDPALVSLARQRVSGAVNTRCQVTDAYTLDGISGSFTAAFANYWWSHIPTSRVDNFLTTLHSKLQPRALVMFMDSLPYYYNGVRRRDAAGDLLEERTLGDGRKFEIIKNFPTESEIVSALRHHADDVLYKQYTAVGHWTVSYRAKVT